MRKRGQTVKGEAVGINKDGVLILELEDGSLVKVMAGECVHVKNKNQFNSSFVVSIFRYFIGFIFHSLFISFQ